MKCKQYILEVFLLDGTSVIWKPKIFAEHSVSSVNNITSWELHYETLKFARLEVQLSR